MPDKKSTGTEATQASVPSAAAEAKKYQKAYLDALREQYEKRLDTVDLVVERQIQNASEAILGATLGLQKRFGDWEVRDKSPLANQVGQAALTAAMTALPDFMAQVTATRPRILTAARKAYEESFRERLLELVRERAEADAEKAVEALLDKPETTNE